MATFRVGQRVRLVRPVNPANAGITGQILHVGPFAEGEFLDGRMFSISCDCVVRWDDDGNDCSQFFWQLEPQVPHHEPCDAEFKAYLDALLEREAVRA